MTLEESPEGYTFVAVILAARCHPEPAKDLLGVAFS